MIADILSNLGLLAIAGLVIFFLASRTACFRKSLVRQIFLGIVFGCLSAVVILVPVHVGDATFDTRAGPAILAGFFGGWPAALPAALIGATARLVVGGEFALSGALSLFVYAAFGWLAGAFLRKRGNTALGLPGFAAMAVIGTIAVLPLILVATDLQTGIATLAEAWPLLLIGNMSSVVLLGMIVRELETVLARSDALKAAGDALGHERYRLDAILASAPDAIITVNTDQRIERFNQAAEEIFDWPADEIIGKPVHVLLPKPHQEKHRDLVGNYLTQKVEVRRAMAGLRVVRAVRRDGSDFPAFVTLSRFSIDGENYAIAVARDVTDELARRQQLADMSVRLVHELEEAERANRAKSDFLAKMSHELRSPLNAIIGFAQMLESGITGKIDPQRKTIEYARDIRFSAEHQLGLINDLLDIAHIENGEVDLKTEPFEAREPVLAAYRLAKAAAREKGIRLRAEARRSLPSVIGDSRAVRQMLFNLLNNGIKFTDAGGKVVLSSQRIIRDGKPYLRYSVTDDGCGIASDQLANIGKPFFQIDSSATLEHTGSGLGLAITKGLAERMGGSLEVESQLGEGTTFSVIMPITLDASLALPAKASA
ncbi:MAG: ATP-binding protein [Magnetovibrionaceae bacterium]